MSSIPPRKPPAPTVGTPEEKRGPAAPSNLERALASKDVADLNVHLFKAQRQARDQPEAFRQVFGTLHAKLNESVRTGAPMQHKAEVANFLTTAGRKRLETLTADIIDAKVGSSFQQNIAEAKFLLAAGYGGKDTAVLTNRVNLRSFGASPEASTATRAETMVKAAKKSVSGLKNALNSVGKGVSALGQSAAKKLPETNKKGNGAGEE